MRIKQIYIMGVLFFLTSGCVATQPVQPLESGRQVKVNYTCRAMNGDVMATTLPSIARDSAIKKSRIFSNESGFSPARLIAGQDVGNHVPGEVRFFKDELLTKLAHALVGKEKGKTQELTIESNVPQGLEEQGRYRVVERTRTRPRVKQIKLDEFLMGHKQKPEQGQILSRNGQDYARVTAVDPDKVTLEYINVENLVVETPWGIARSKIENDMIVSRLEARAGTLVRTGGLIGRITKSNEENILVDYGHPFGGEILKCTVEILPDSQAKPAGNPVNKYFGQGQ